MQIPIALGIYCPSKLYNIHNVFHVSYALILGLKDEPYDFIIIVHVFLCCRVHQVGRAP